MICIRMVNATVTSPVECHNVGFPTSKAFADIHNPKRSPPNLGEARNPIDANTCKTNSMIGVFVSGSYTTGMNRLYSSNIGVRSPSRCINHIPSPIRDAEISK